MLSLSEIFLDSLGTDYSKENIIYALDKTEKKLRGRIGHFEEEIMNSLFTIDSKEMNSNFDELRCFWDVFAEFEQITVEERYKYWNGEAEIVKLCRKMNCCSNCSDKMG